MWGFILALIIGGIAGYIAEQIMKADHGLVINVVLGVVGAFLFNLVLWVLFGVHGGNILWQLIAGVIGASILIWLYREYKTRS